MPHERRPRILFCTDTFPPQVNGVSVVTALSVSGLTTRGWDCAVISPRYPGIADDPFRHDPAYAALTPGLSVPSIPMPGYADLRLTWPRRAAVRRCFTTFAPDVVHCSTEFVIGSVGLREAHARAIPVTTSYHTDFARYTDAYGLRFARPAVTRHIRRFHQRAAITFTPSQPARQDLLDLGVQHAEVWGCGVDTTLFHPRHRDTVLRGQYGGSHSCIFLHVGRMAPEKGIDRVLRAFRLARESAPEHPMHLVLAGSGPSEPQLRALGGADVSFLANLDRSTVLPQLYASADAFVFASTTETLGLVILEAMASGLPVVAAPAGGVADHLRHGYNGLAYPADDLAAMADHMVTIARDHEARRRLGARARMTAERLTWDAELDRLDDRYRRLLKLAPPPTDRNGVLHS